jgi:hypothetical protein
MNQDRLQQIADLTDHPDLRVKSMVPVLHWVIDEQTGRPVSHWILRETTPAWRG